MMTEKELLYMERRKKKISLKMLSEYIGCSISMVSLYETDKSNFSENKEILYKEFIREY